MPQRLNSSPSRPKLFFALKSRLEEGYRLSHLKADLLAGIVVGLASIPLGMALAISSGVPPQHGLYTVMIGGAMIALFGGSRFQVSGPTAAFVVVLAPISLRFGLGGLLLSGLMGGGLIVGMGLLRLGRWIRFVPHEVTSGFTTGIALVIMTLQLKDFFGLKIVSMPESYAGKWGALFEAWGTFSWAEVSVGLSTLLLLHLWPRIQPKVPAPLATLTLVGGVVVILESVIPGFEIATIGSRFAPGIPRALPSWNWPWELPGPGGAPLVLSPELLMALIPSAVSIALLGVFESLVTAMVADQISSSRHDPDCELLGLGVGNLICPLFGAIPAAGAVSRTAMSIRSGAESPLASVFHGLFTLVAVVLLAPVISHLPMASLAALLILVAFQIAGLRKFFALLSTRSRENAAVLLVTCFLTLFSNMVIGVAAGVVLSLVFRHTVFRSSRTKSNR